MTVDIDPIRLEVAWNRLVSIASEQAATMVNSSFSAVLGEMEDLSAGVFDQHGTMMAQSVQGAPGHLGTLGLGMKHVCTAYPAGSLEPGDVLITNDPWLVSGHKHDITIVTPVFLDGRLVGFAASNCHTVDVGGRVFSAGAPDIYEEGLTIPLMKLYRAGMRDETLINIIAGNVRSPDLVLGDLAAQVSANETAARRMVEFMRESDLEDLSPLADAMTRRTERLMRDAIRQLPDGIYTDSVELDGFDDPLSISVAIEVAGDAITVDYAGTSAQVPKGINSVLNYTKAFTQYALKCLLSPDAPTNDGAFAPIEVRAPEACLLNARYPAAVGGRHLVGLYIPFAIFGALARILPDRIVADSSVLSALTLTGVDAEDQRFIFTFFSSGGMGARAQKHGLDATAFPSNVANVPIEVMEHAAPVLVTCRELIANSAGSGTWHGGAGQRISLTLHTPHPAIVSCMVERTKSPPRGFLGGTAGQTARLLLGSDEIDPKQNHRLLPGQHLVLETPGGGGLGPTGVS
jgi:N-methylhydantoinase B